MVDCNSYQEILTEEVSFMNHRLKRSSGLFGILKNILFGEDVSDEVDEIRKIQTKQNMILKKTFTYVQHSEAGTAAHINDVESAMKNTLQHIDDMEKFVNIII